MKNLSTEFTANISGDAFSSGAYWEGLSCDGDFINEAMPHGLRALRVPSEETPVVKQQKFNNKFDMI